MDKKYKLNFKDGTSKVIEGKLYIDTLELTREFKTDDHSPESINKMINDVMKEVNQMMKINTENETNFQISNISVNKLETEQELTKNNIYIPTINSYLQKEKKYVIKMVINTCKIVEKDTLTTYHYYSIEEIND